MSIHYGDTAQDPQDAAKEIRIADDISLTPAQAAEWFDGKPLVTVEPPKWMMSFCATDESGLKILRRPWSAGGFTWATDATIMVRVPEIIGYQFDHSFNYPNIAAVWKEYQPGEFEPLPTTGLLPPTAGHKQKCPECAGRNVLQCSECKVDHDCAGCNGVGLTRDFRWTTLLGKRFRLRHLARIAKLTNPQVCISQCGNGLMFRSEETEGVLATIKHLPEEDPQFAALEWKPETAAADSREAT